RAPSRSTRAGARVRASARSPRRRRRRAGASAGTAARRAHARFRRRRTRSTARGRASSRRAPGSTPCPGSSPSRSCPRSRARRTATAFREYRETNAGGPETDPPLARAARRLRRRRGDRRGVGDARGPDPARERGDRVPQRHRHRRRPRRGRRRARRQGALPEGRRLRRAARRHRGQGAAQTRADRPHPRLTPRAVVLVEGKSDRSALEALAERRGRDLAAEGVEIVPIGGAQAIARFLAHYTDRGVRLAGLCDAGEEREYWRGLERAGLASQLTRAAAEELGFFACDRDLEDELIRAVGADRVVELLAEHGDLVPFR